MLSSQHGGSVFDPGSEFACCSIRFPPRTQVSSLQPKDMKISLSGFVKLPVSVNVSVYGLQ